MENTESTPCKVCIKCGRLLPLDDFYKHSRMADGHLNKCKECTKRDVKKNRAENKDYYVAYDKKRAMRPDRAAARKEYISSEAGKKVRTQMTRHEI